MEVSHTCLSMARLDADASGYFNDYLLHAFSFTGNTQRVCFLGSSAGRYEPAHGGYSKCRSSAMFGVSLTVHRVKDPTDATGYCIVVHKTGRLTSASTAKQVGNLHGGELTA